MEKKEIVVGIDVSKATLDICILIDHDSENFQIKNEPKAIRSFFKKVLKENQERKMFVCMENTGYYNWPCYEIFDEIDLSLFVVNPLHLKKSMGLTRGKNDAIDAFRIAKFISLHKENLKKTLIPRKQIRIMQALLAQRNRLVETRKKFNVPTKELIFIATKELAQKIAKSSQKMIEEINVQIKYIENQLNELIDNDIDLKQQYKYVTSVQGVGKVLAWTILIKTNEFKSISGVVPFEFQSGTSINKKPRVSYMADKSLKKLLHLAAMRAIQLNGDLQNYYLRKVKEGKNKMLILNAVRNKIVARICSVIKNRKMYQINLQLS